MSPSGNSFVGSKETWPFRNCDANKLRELSQLYFAAVVRIRNDEKIAKANINPNK